MNIPNMLYYKKKRKEIANHGNGNYLLTWQIHSVEYILLLLYSPRQNLSNIIKGGIYKNGKFIYENGQNIWGKDQRE